MVLLDTYIIVSPTYSRTRISELSAGGERSMDSQAKVGRAERIAKFLEDVYKKSRKLHGQDTSRGGKLGDTEYLQICRGPVLAWLLTE